MKKILTEAAAMGDATAQNHRVSDARPAGYYFKDSNWRLPFFGGYKFEWPPGVANLDCGGLLLTFSPRV